MSDKIRKAAQRAREFALGLTEPMNVKAHILGLCDLLDVAVAQQPAPEVPEGAAAHQLDHVEWWANAYEREGGHAVIVDMLRAYSAMLAAAPAPAPAPDAPAPAAQEPAAFYWQDLYAFPMTARRHGPYFGWPSEDAIARCQRYTKPVPLYAAPPTVTAAQEPIKLSDEVRDFLQEWIDSATGGEDADVDYGFANQLALLLGPLYTAPPAAEQPDTVKMRDLLKRYFNALDRFDREGPVSLVVAAAKEADVLEQELRALLGKEGA